MATRRVSNIFIFTLLWVSLFAYFQILAKFHFLYMEQFQLFQYTPYFGYVDEKGKTFKPFLLPQKDVDHYKWLMKSYNIPEFIISPSSLDAFKLSRLAKSDNKYI